MVADDLLEDELEEGRDWVALQQADPLSGLELYVERDGTLLEEDLNEAGQEFAAKHYNTFMGVYDRKISARHGGPYRAPVSAETYHESVEWLNHLLHHG